MSRRVCHPEKYPSTAPHHVVRGPRRGPHGRMLPPMPGVTTTEVDETSAPHPDAPFGAGPRKRKRCGGGGSDRPRSLVRTSVTLVLGLLLTVVFSWSVIAVLDASSFPGPLHHLRHRLFDSPVLVPSLMAVWV